MGTLGIREGQNVSWFAGTSARAAVQYGKVRYDGIWRVEGESGTTRGVCTRFAKAKVWGSLVSISSHDSSC
jgi:hypothetical protein